MSRYPNLDTSNALLRLADDGRNLIGMCQYQTEDAEFEPGSQGEIHPQWRQMIPYVQSFVADIPSQRLVTYGEIKKILIDAHRYYTSQEPAFDFDDSSVPTTMRVLSTAGYPEYTGDTVREDSNLTVRNEPVKFTHVIKSDASDGREIKVACWHPDSKTTRIVWPICKIATEEDEGGQAGTQRSEAAAEPEVDGSVGTASAMSGPVRE